MLCGEGEWAIQSPPELGATVVRSSGFVDLDSSVKRFIVIDNAIVPPNSNSNTNTST